MSWERSFDSRGLMCVLLHIEDVTKRFICICRFRKQGVIRSGDMDSDVKSVMDVILKFQILELEGRNL